jgi:putative hemolysin
MEIEIAIAVFLLLLLVFLATIDMAFSQLSDVGLRRLAADYEASPRVKTVAFLQTIIEDRPRFRFALSTAIQILLIIFSVLVTLIVSGFNPPYFQLLAISIVIGLIASIVFRQFLPRLLTRKNPERRLLALLPFVRPVYGVLSTVADPFRFFSREESPIEVTILPNQPVSEEDKEDNAEDKQALIEMGEAEGILEEKDRELLETMFEFGETKAGRNYDSAPGNRRSAA